VVKKNSNILSIGTRRPFKLLDETPIRTNGNPVANSELIYKGWGEFSNPRSDRTVLNNMAQVDKFFEIKFRFKSDVQVNVNTRVIYNGNKYTVQGIRRDGEKRFYRIITVQAKAFS
jgi:hypothetical protein